MKSLSFVSHKHRFKDHPNFKNFYARIGIPTIENAANQLDPEMILLNWDVLKLSKTKIYLCLVMTYLINFII